MTETRVDALAARLRTLLQKGVYTSGARLIELQFAQEMNVSQVTVRTALQVLEQEGWVVKHPRRGVTVRTFTADQAEEVVLLWAAVEALVLRWVIPKLKKADRVLLYSHVRRAQRAAMDRKPGLALAMLFEWHLALAHLAHERELTVTVLERLHNQARLLEAMRSARCDLDLAALHALVAGHERLSEQIDAQDEDGADSTLRAQIAAYGVLVIAALRE